MNHKQLQKHALESAMEDYISNLPDLLEEGRTLENVLQLLQEADLDNAIMSDELEFLEQYDMWSTRSIYNEIRSMENAYLRDYERVLNSVMGDEAFITWKKEK